MSVNAAQLVRAIEAADRPAPAGPQFRQAAVFVLLAQRQKTCLLLIHRADRGDPWSNHIAFPGGHIDPADASPRETAYRETLEEIGLDRHDITYLADLGHFQTRQAAMDLHAFVGLCRATVQFRADPSEVARVYEVPLKELLRQHRRNGFANSSPEQLGDQLAYRWEGQTIWGVTARIIHHLLKLAAPQLQSATEPRP